MNEGRPVQTGRPFSLAPARDSSLRETNEYNNSTSIHPGAYARLTNKTNIVSRAIHATKASHGAAIVRAAQSAPHQPRTVRMLVFR